MFLKNRKRLPWICCILAALFLSLGWTVSGTGSGKPEVQESMAASFTMFQEVAENSEAARETKFSQEEEGMRETEIIGETEIVPEEEEVRETGILPEKTDVQGDMMLPAEILRLSEIVLLAAGVVLGGVFIFFMRQEKAYGGPDMEAVLVLLSAALILVRGDFPVILQILYFWALFSAGLTAVRGIWWWGRNGFVPEWSAGHRLGLSAAENAGKPGRYFVFQAVWCAVLLVVCVESAFLVYQGELRFLPGMGCFVAVVLSVICFLRGTRDVDHLSAQIHLLHEGQSVSVRKGMLEEEEEKLLDLIRQRDEAVETAVTGERFKVDLISNVSHDLRTPLTAILGYGELLKKEQLSEEGNRQLAELNRKAGYMSELVDSLFELTKVSSGVVECKKEQIDLIRLLEQTIGLFNDELNHHHLQIRRHYVMDSVPVVTDGARMHQVFANLLGNAIKYTLPGTRIHLEVTSSEEYYMVRMTNIASYEMDFQPEEIVQRFARGDKARTTKGSGLGLAIAQTYTESVGGTFQVQVDGEQFSAIVTLPA